MANSATGARGQQFQEARRQQPLRRDIEQIKPSGQKILLHARRRAWGQAGVETGRRHTQLPQRRDLIMHERDQRRDDDARTRPQQRRKLVAQRLAAAGRHQHQRVAACGDMRDDGCLLTAKGEVAVDALKQGKRGIGHRRVGL